MLELFSANTTIVLGLSLNDQEDHLIQSAVSLAQRTSAQLILVHAAQPYRNYSIAREGFVLPYEEFEKESFDEDLALAQNKIEMIRDTLPTGLVCETRVLRDFAEDALEEVARSTKAVLILCGFHKQQPARFLHSMSTGLSLMAHARHPVMVIPHESFVDFQSQPLTVLIADDLKEDGEQALRGALGFCRSIGVNQMVHAHVNVMSYREINQMVDKIRVAMLEGRIPIDPAFNSQVYIDQTKLEIKSLLKQRIEAMDPSFIHEFKYRPAVRFGLPIEEVHRLTLETKSQVLIFGKHHILHRGRLSIGKIPYEAMVEPHVATIIVPDAHSGPGME